MSLFTRYRQWKFSAPPIKSYWPMWLLVFITFGIGYTLGKDSVVIPVPPTPEIVCSSDKEQLFEYQNRLDIKEQALIKLNEVSNGLRKRQQFLMRMLTAEVQIPSKKAKKGKVNLRHFSMQALPNSYYQYQIFIDYDDHQSNTKYGLTLKFDRGEDETVSIDGSTFFPSNGKRIAMPFTGMINGHKRQLKTSTFHVKQKGKVLFSLQHKFDGGS